MIVNSTKRVLATLLVAGNTSAFTQVKPRTILTSNQIKRPFHNYSILSFRHDGVSNQSDAPIVRLRIQTALYDKETEETLDSSFLTNRNALKIVNAACLVAGTTIGGGFLALPSVVAPSGFYPSATTLIGVWIYFLAQAFILVECINRTKKNSCGESPPGVAAAAKSVFGSKGEIAVGIILTILIEATLVSQISRAGMLFPNYRVGCLLSALSIAATVFGPKSGVAFASNANAALTSLFLLSTFTVFGCGIGLADWSRLSVANSWSSIPSAVPTFLQLLVYGEIVPTVCQILNYNTKHVHSAIIFGSLMTLCLQIGWSGLGISLVASATSIDPVAVLLASSGPVQIPLFCLALTAILTTLLGSYLALLSTANDFIQQKEKIKTETEPSSNTFGFRMKIASVITLPASLIACSSPSIFLRAIDFAGSYPVLVLWGVFPPAIALIQRFRDKKFDKEGAPDGRSSSVSMSTSGPSVWLALMGLSSLAMVGANAGQDLFSSLSKFFN